MPAAQPLPSPSERPDSVRPDSVHYGVGERPAVDVRHENGQWYPGRLHSWLRTPSGWRAVVSYTTGPGLQHYLDVPAPEVRPAVDQARVSRRPAGDPPPER